MPSASASRDRAAALERSDRGSIRGGLEPGLSRQLRTRKHAHAFGGFRRHRASARRSRRRTTLALHQQFHFFTRRARAQRDRRGDGRRPVTSGGVLARNSALNLLGYVLPTLLAVV